GDVLLVVEAAHDADAPPDEAAEDHEIERRGHHRGHDGLAPDADYAPVLADDDGLEADPAHHVEIDGWRRRPGHGAHRRAPAGSRGSEIVMRSRSTMRRRLSMGRLRDRVAGSSR